MLYHHIEYLEFHWLISMYEYAKANLGCPQFEYKSSLSYNWLAVYMIFNLCDRGSYHYSRKLDFQKIAMGLLRKPGQGNHRSSCI